MDYQGAIHRPAVLDNLVTLEIEKGDSLDNIASKLTKLRLSFRPIWLKVIAVANNYHKKIKTGEYELKPGLTLPGILELIVQGKTKQYSITFLEGWRFSEILAEVEKNPNLEHQLKKSDFASLMGLLGADKNFPLSSNLESNENIEQGKSLSLTKKTDEHVQSAESMSLFEGLIFPDTYYFEKHMTDVSLLKRAHEKMRTILEREWQSKAEDLPFKTPYEALILASIVEKETGNKAERPQIAGVFTRRLQNGMMLQTDPTVIYGMGDQYHGNITLTDLKTATPYNTYVVKGLPPTPIAMPGREAINSVLHPDNSKNLYFVARGDGSHEFSATLKDHNSAVDTYQRQRKKTDAK
jgi:UPF0755 protein